MTSHALGLFAYPWDVLDEGAVSVLDAVERAGLNTLYIATWYHSGMFLLPHSPRRKVYFPQPGALYLTPSDWHRAHPLAPPVSELCDEWKSFWTTLSGDCRARGIALAAWMPVLHNSGLGTAHPEVAAQNAWGDVITHTLCPANDSVVDLVRHVMSDVAALGVFDRVLLESIEYLPLRHGHHHEVIGIDFDAEVDFLASLSFSPAIERRIKEADGAAERVRSFVRETCDAAFRGEPRELLGWAGLEAAADGELGRYLRVREQGVTRVLEAATAALRQNGGPKIGLLDFGPLYGLGPNGRRWQNGVDLDAQLPLVDDVHPTYYFADLRVLSEKVAAYRATIGGSTPVIPAVRAILPHTTDAASLAAQVSVVMPGSAGISFYNYSFMRHETLDWIRRAVPAA